MATIITILAVAAVFLIAARHLQRSFFYPRPTQLPENVDGDTEALLKRFEAALRAHLPDVLDALQPGLSEDQISAIESQFGFRLTGELRALYRWRNGSAPEPRHDLIPGHTFLPLDHAAQLRAEHRRQISAAPLVQRIAYYIFAGHRTNWLTVLDDGCGDGYFYDPAARRRPGNFFYHFAEDRQYRFFPSLTNFLAGASECYESRIYRAGHRGRAAENYEQSFPLWQRYSAWPGM